MIMNTVHLKQGTEEWLKWRQNKCTASNAPIIAGYPADYWKTKTWDDLRLRIAGLEKPMDDFGKRAVEHGKKLEPEVRQRLAPDTKPACIEADDSRFAASLDGLASAHWVEIKAPYSKYQSKLLRAFQGVEDAQERIDRIPPHVWWQLVHQAGVIGNADMTCKPIVFVDPDVLRGGRGASCATD